MGPLESGGDDISFMIDLTDPPAVLAAPPSMPVFPDLDPSGYVVDWQIDDIPAEAAAAVAAMEG